MKVCFTDLDNEPRFDVTIGYPYRATLFIPPLLHIMKRGGTLYAYKGRFIITDKIFIKPDSFRRTTGFTDRAFLYK